MKDIILNTNKHFNHIQQTIYSNVPYQKLENVCEIYAHPDANIFIDIKREEGEKNRHNIDKHNWHN